jgi:Virulence factor BrkB
VLVPLDSSLRAALQAKGTAATALGISVAVALYGTTGVLEAARRALNVVFEVPGGRSFLRRKAIDVASTLVLMTLILASLVMGFVGGRFAEDLLGFIGLGPPAGRQRSSLASVVNRSRSPTGRATARPRRRAPGPPRLPARLALAPWRIGPKGARIASWS